LIAAILTKRSSFNKAIIFLIESLNTTHYHHYKNGGATMKAHIAKTVFVGLFFITTFFAESAFGAAIFTDDFEGDLSLWTGKSGGIFSGITVVDPLRAGNRVLSFTALNIEGDIYSLQQFSLTAGQRYRISFEYLGLAKPGSVDGDFGGFAGLSEDLPGRHLWYYGTSNDSGADPKLIDDGQWRTYTFDFVPPVSFIFGGGGSGSAVHLMFEDFLGSGGVGGDAYFDNVSLAPIPLPATVWLLAFALVSLLGLRKRFQR
jgi:hypothetical protein